MRASPSSRDDPFLVGALLAIVLLLLAASAAAARQAPTDTPIPLPDATADPLFNDEILQELRLTINPRDWQDLRDNFLSNRYYPCHLTWNGITVRNVGIRSRGTGSRSGTKPGLRVDFDYYTAKQRFLNLKSIVLRNQTQDPSMLHESVAMKMFARMGIPASREAHVKLYVNDEYVGLYAIVESVDKVFLERHYRENDGYLYEYDYDADDEPWRFEYRGNDPALYSPKPFKPATHEKDPDPKPIEAFIRTIDANRGPAFVSRIAEFVDINQFLAHVAVENFVSDLDGILGNYGVNNFYFYRFEKKNLSTFIPWDKSEAFKDTFEHSIWHNIDVISTRRNRLMERSMEVPELIDAYLDALARAAEIAAAPVSPPVAPDLRVGLAPSQKTPGWLETEILRQYQLIREAALADPFKPFSNDEFEAGVRAMVAFAQGRSRYVNEAVARARSGR